MIPGTIRSRKKRIVMKPAPSEVPTIRQNELMTTRSEPRKVARLPRSCSTTPQMRIPLTIADSTGFTTEPRSVSNPDRARSRYPRKKGMSGR